MVLPPGVNSESWKCMNLVYSIMVWCLGVWSGGILQNMEFTLDGLIWNSGVFNYGFGYV